ncbi:MAG: single-stranded DNA-binding protein [Melioribacteraceae bacterium]|nr:single-stranded DNA-binding protein [Melioribacteraceae bacterium]
MAFSLNKVMLIGNLGQDAENRFTTNNISVTTFSIATSRSYKTKDDNWANETTWHNIVAYNLSDYYKEKLKKGKKVYVEGRISKREYTDKENIKRNITEIVSENIILLDSSETNDKNFENKKPDEPEVENTDNSDLPF